MSHCFDSLSELRCWLPQSVGNFELRLCTRSPKPTSQGSSCLALHIDARIPTLRVCAKNTAWHVTLHCFDGPSNTHSRTWSLMHLPMFAWSKNYTHVHQPQRTRPTSTNFRRKYRNRGACRQSKMCAHSAPQHVFGRNNDWLTTSRSRLLRSENLHTTKTILHCYEQLITTHKTTPPTLQI